MTETIAAEIAAKRKQLRLIHPEPLESQVLSSVLRALNHHPKVGLAWRMNTGAGHLAHSKGGMSQFMRFGFKGSPDVYGYLRDGRALFVECKRPSGRVSSEQQAFIDAAQKAGCVAFVARGIEDVMATLDAL